MFFFDGLDFDVGDVVDAFQVFYDFWRNLCMDNVDGDCIAAASDLSGVVCAYVNVVVS